MLVKPPSNLAVVVKKDLISWDILIHPNMFYAKWKIFDG